ncbi:MAG: hypothetical protein KOO62_00850 [candidate division Zixibacteria bacterium]|nr:hypothetical protein [candidate division Zixibacteria bacterium]
MKDSRRLTNHGVSRVLVLAICLLIVSIGLIPATVSSEAIADQRESNYKVWVQGGFFTPARGKMRSIYGDALSVAGGAEIRISGRLSVGAYGGYLELDKGDIPLKYRNIYVVPTVTFSLLENERLNLYSQLGVGLNFREIQFKWLYEQRDFGLSGNMAVGVDYLLSGPFILGARTTFDFIYDPDPTLGDFGNTGGFNFQIRGGLVF